MRIPENVPVEVGEFESDSAGSGLTAIIMNEENVAGISQRGGAPGTMGTEVLHPLHRKHTSVDAIVLAGRSIFGIIAAMGVIKMLKEEGRGLKVRGFNVPVVPVAVIFDFIENYDMPDESWGVKAYRNRRKEFNVGRHGAGRGATVGKVLGIEHSTPSGQGFSYVERNGLYALAITVVNALGDVYGPNGDIIAGARKNGKFVNTVEYILNKGPGENFDNTTLGVVITNATMDREDACSVAEAANISLSGVIRPFNTTYDGDTFFTIAFSEIERDLEMVKLIAQEAVKSSVYSIFNS